MQGIPNVKDFPEAVKLKKEFDSESMKNMMQSILKVSLFFAMLILVSTITGTKTLSSILYIVLFLVDIFLIFAYLVRKISKCYIVELTAEKKSKVDFKGSKSAFYIETDNLKYPVYKEEDWNKIKENKNFYALMQNKRIIGILEDFPKEKTNKEKH